MQNVLKIIKTLSCWYSLESSRWVLSDEYPFTRVSITFQVLHYFVLAKLATSSIRVNHSCLEISMTSVVCTCDTFENNFEINHKFEKYLKDSCKLVSGEYSSSKYFLEIDFNREISIKQLGGFGRCRHEWGNTFILRAAKTGLTILEIFIQQKHFLENIWRKKC